MARTVQQLTSVQGGTSARVVVSFAVCWVLILHAVALAWMARSGQPDPALAQFKAGPPVASVRLMVPSSVEAPAALPSPVSKAPPDQAPPPDQAQGGDDAIDLDGYVPRPWLTMAPQPQAPILLPFPPQFQDRARYTARLSLFIEADGRVGRVEFEGAPLPQVLARAARQAFEHARFTPGEVKGRIVKSLIKVEVDFDSLGSGPVQAG